VTGVGAALVHDNAHQLVFVVLGRVSRQVVVIAVLAHAQVGGVQLLLADVLLGVGLHVERHGELAAIVQLDVPHLLQIELEALEVQHQNAGQFLQC
jgi:predicted short-subunit dehydrogenase-like oxidoreductase (DUF2520 family)